MTGTHSFSNWFYGPRFRRGGCALFGLLVCLVLSFAGFAPVQAREPVPSQIATIELERLPPEAIQTLGLIKKGGPYPHRKDGVIFSNREKILPFRQRGYYTEYTVKTPGSRDRGARRIVAGGDPQGRAEFYYTDDHYESFKRIRE